MDNVNEKTFDLLEANGLNWKVNKEPLFTEDGKPTNHFGIYRNDNDGFLGCVGNQYRPYQNFEMAELMVRASEGIGLETSRGSFLQQGKKVYMQIALDDKFIGTDTIKRHITCLNSHDGSTAIGFGSANQVVVCENTFYMAYKESGMNKFRHSANSKEAVERAMKDLRVTIGLDEKLMKSYEIMAESKIGDEIFSKVMQKAFNVDLDKKMGDISKQKQNQLIEVNQVIESELESHGATLWGLFNAVTYYTNHIAPSKDTNDYIMSGAGYDKNLVTYNEIMKWIVSNSPESKELVLI